MKRSRFKQTHALQAVAWLLWIITLSGSYSGCGGSGAESSGRLVLVDLDYPPPLAFISEDLIVEGTLFKTDAMAPAAKSAGPARAVSKNSSHTSLEFAFSDVPDGTYYLQILFKSELSSPAAVSQSVAKTASQEQCVAEMWELARRTCEDNNVVELCRQTIEEECRQAEETAEETEDGPSQENTNADQETLAPQMDNPGYQESTAPILASLAAEITFGEGKNARVQFQQAHFNLSYDDDEDGETNLNEIVEVTSDGPLPSRQWTLRQSGGPTLYDVAYGNNRFVAVGHSGTILVSSDGNEWTSANSSTGRTIYGVTYGNNVFVAVGYNVALRSTDGNTWTPIEGPFNIYRDVLFANNIFVAVAVSGAIMTSTDGILWTQRDSGTNAFLNSVGYGNGLFVAAGQEGTVLTSPDGETWTLRDAGTFQELNAVTYHNDTFVAVGRYGLILTSPDGVSWREVQSGVDWWLQDIVSEGDNLVVVGINCLTILVSSDGEMWTEENLADRCSNLMGVTYAATRFVAVGFQGVILTSH